MVDLSTIAAPVEKAAFDVVAPADAAALRQRVGALVARVEVAGVFVGEARDLWVEFDRIGRLVDAAKVLLAGRVHESGVWRRAGERDAATYLARTSGGSIGAARRALSTCRRLESLPRTRQAVVRGELSRGQAEAIADAAAINPDAEDRLLGSADRMSLAELREECLRAKATGDPDPEATQRRIHAGRFLRTRTDAEGAWCLQARGTAQDGAVVNRALEPLITRLFQRSREDQSPDVPIRRETLGFDALVQLSRHEGADDHLDEATISGSTGAAIGDDVQDDPPPDGDASGREPSSDRARRRRRGRRPGRFRGATTPNYTALIRADLSALVRGHPVDGELCEISGIGPVPVSIARSLLGESILHLVITRGRDANVTYLGRGPNAVQRLALLWRNPVCSVQGCACTLVDSDHRLEWRFTKRTRLDELDLLCDFHHDLKTGSGWALVDGHGKRPFVPPDDPRHPSHQRNTTVATPAA